MKAGRTFDRAKSEIQLAGWMSQVATPEMPEMAIWATSAARDLIQHICEQVEEICGRGDSLGLMAIPLDWWDYEPPVTGSVKDAER